MNRRGLFARLIGFAAAMVGVRKLAARTSPIAIVDPKTIMLFSALRPTPISYDSRPLTREMAEAAMRNLSSKDYWIGARGSNGSVSCILPPRTAVISKR